MINEGDMYRCGNGTYADNAILGVLVVWANTAGMCTHQSFKDSHINRLKIRVTLNSLHVVHRSIVSRES